MKPVIDHFSLASEDLTWHRAMSYHGSMISQEDPMFCIMKVAMKKKKSVYSYFLGVVFRLKSLNRNVDYSAKIWNWQILPRSMYSRFIPSLKCLSNVVEREGKIHRTMVGHSSWVWKGVLDLRLLVCFLGLP